MDIEVVDRDADRATESRRATGRTIATVAILAVLVVSGLAVQSVITSRHNRAPYAAAAIHAGVRMDMVAPGRAQAVVDHLAGPGRLSALVVEPVEGRPTQRQVIGQVTFRTPHSAPKGGQYALFVIDRALGKPVPAVYATGPAGTNVAQGWDGRYGQVAAQYPWLRMLSDTPAPDGSGVTSPGMAVSFAPDTPGPITFAAVLDPSSLPVTDPSQQLTVALVFIGANDHIHWATKLAG